MDAGAVEEFAVAEIKHFGGIFGVEMLPRVSILSLPVSLIVHVNNHWIVRSQNFTTYFLRINS